MLGNKLLFRLANTGNSNLWVVLLVFGDGGGTIVEKLIYIKDFLTIRKLNN